MICSLLPGMPVFVSDRTEVWLEGTISRINNTTCTVLVISRQVCTYIENIRILLYSRYMYIVYGKHSQTTGKT